MKKLILAKNLKPGDVFKLPPENISIKHIENLSKRLSTPTANALVVKGVAKSGPWRNVEGEVVLLASDKVELVSTITDWDKAKAWFIATFNRRVFKALPPPNKDESEDQQ